jgi:uncharacterized protein (DUF2141 family)
MQTLFFLISLFFSVPTSGENAHIELKLNNLKNSKGQIVVSVYQSEKGFPYEPSTYFTYEKENITNGTLTILIPVPKQGNYALSVLDDSNRNMEMDKNMLGIPKEGFGFSNNASPRGFRPPAFEDALIKVNSERVKTSIEIKYF